MKTNGQASAETTIAVFFLLLLFFLVNLQYNYKIHEINGIRENFSELATCKKLSYLISSIASSQPQTEMLAWIDSNAEVRNGNVVSGESVCFFFGEAENVLLSSGNIRLLDLNGTVVLENV